MKFKEKCPFCKEDNSSFEYNQFKPLSLHIRSHNEIPLVERQDYLERMKRKSFGASNSKSKLLKKLKSKSGKKRRNFQLAQHRKMVLSILKDLDVEDFHLENIEKAGDIKAINDYISKQLELHYEKFKEKMRLYKEAKARDKRRKDLKSVKLIYTPMGNKR